jgi:hypothetical protein
MDTIRPGKGPICSRRTFTTGLGGLALGAFGTTGAPLLAQTIQIGGTPAAPPVAPSAAPLAGESLDEIAVRLGYDQDAIVAFVRDEIAYEAYEGILRGAQGTLAARAGNSADQAVLLSALLETAQIEHRFVAGSLDPARERQITDALARTPDTVQAAYRNASEAAARHALGLGPDDPLPVTPDAATQEMIARTQPSADAALDLALTATDVSIRAITDALATAGIELPAFVAAPLPESERTQHAWIQIADGPSWIDVDPTLPADTEPPTAPTQTMDALPDEWHHRVSIAIEGEIWRGGTTTRQRVASLDATSSRLAPIPVAVALANTDALIDTGFAISQIAGGQTGFMPWIYADVIGVIADTPILVTTDTEAATDSLGPLDTATGGIRDGESLAVWLVIDITSPGAAPVHIERALLDRIPPSQRLSGMIDPVNLLPLELVTTESGTTLRALDRLTVITTDVARTPSLFAMTRYASDQVFGPVGAAGPSLGDLRTALGTLGEETNGAWSYPSAPNLTAFTMDAGDDGRARMILDLLHRRRTVLPIEATSPADDVHPMVRAAVLDAVAEQVFLAPGLPDGQDVEAGPSIGAIFTAATEQGIPVTVLASSADLAGMTLDPASERLITTALEGGNAIIIPEQPVELAGSPVRGWWMVNLSTGEVRDQLQDGRSGASVSFPFGGSTGPRFAPMGEYAKLMLTIENFIVRHAYCLVGAGVAGIMFRSVILFGLAGGEAGTSGVAIAGTAGGFAGGVATIACG